MVLEEVVQVSKIKNINFDKIVFNSGYWKHRYELNRDVSLKCVRNRFETTSRFESLRFTYKEGKDRPHVFFDSDVAKWIEAVAYLVKAGNDCSEELALCEELIDSMEKNQREDGYLNSFFQQIEPDNVYILNNISEKEKMILSEKMPLKSMINIKSVTESALFLLKTPDLNGVLMKVDRGWSPYNS